MIIKGLYFITDGRLSRKNNIEDVRAAIRGGSMMVQYREKDKNLIQFLSEALELKRICDESGTAFLINDSVAAALLVNADGVHLGQDDMPVTKAREILGRKKIVGITVHNTEEAINAEKQGADYLGVSPLFATTTKADAGPAAGLDLLKEVKRNVRIPCIAIGGIKESNVDSVIQAGADAVAAISATVPKDDVENAVKFFTAKFIAR